MWTIHTLAGLYLGNKFACSNYVWVKDNNITHIVNVTHHVRNYFEHDPQLHYCRIRARLHGNHDDIHSDDEDDENDENGEEGEEELRKKRKQKKDHNLQQAFLAACSFIWSALSCSGTSDSNNNNNNYYNSNKYNRNHKQWY